MWPCYSSSTSVYVELVSCPCRQQMQKGLEPQTSICRGIGRTLCPLSPTRTGSLGSFRSMCGRGCVSDVVQQPQLIRSPWPADPRIMSQQRLPIFRSMGPVRMTAGDAFLKLWTISRVRTPTMCLGRRMGAAHGEQGFLVSPLC